MTTSPAPTEAKQALRKAVTDFDDFLNTPPEYEDQRMVRDFRHSAYARWRKVADAIAAVLSRTTTDDDGVTFTDGEIRAMRKNPDVLRALATQHDCWESEAAAMDPEVFAAQIKHHRARWKQLEAEADRLEREQQS